jgi:hypothetical protein
MTNQSLLHQSGVECTRTRLAITLSKRITLSSWSDGALSTESTTGSSAIRGAPDGDSKATLSSSAVSTNATSNPDPPTLWSLKILDLLHYYSKNYTLIFGIFILVDGVIVGRLLAFSFKDVVL